MEISIQFSESDPYKLFWFNESIIPFYDEDNKLCKERPRWENNGVIITT